MKDLTELSVSELKEGYLKKHFSPHEVVKAYWERIDSIDKRIKAFLSLNPRALEEARKIKVQVLKDKPLAGIPYSAKDLFLTRNLPTTAGSKMLQGFIPPYESTVTKRLAQAGALLLGKTNLDEFAMGSSTERSAFQITRNPWDLKRVPGGSSGGSAAAVAARMSPFSVGTDTGGSIRQPASFCGVFGLKPTYGRVSRYGIIAMASSLDQAGAFSFSVRDAALILKIIAGFDRYDATSSRQKVLDFEKAVGKSIRGLKIGVIEEFFQTGLDEAVKEKIEEARRKLEKEGAKFVPISLPKVKFGLPIYYILMPAEVSSNLARYDGLRYGLSKRFSSLRQTYELSRAEGFGEEVKRRIMLGTFVLSAGYREAYYLLAQKARTALKNEFKQAFRQVDLLFGPVSPTPAFKIGEKTADPVQMYLADIYTVPVNPAGLPAASVPCGFVEKEKKKLPVAFQLIAPWFREDLIFQVAGRYESISPEDFQSPKI